MTSIPAEVLTILVLLVLNGLLAMSEIAVASRRVRLEQRAAEGSRGAQAALALQREPSCFLSTCRSASH